MTVSVGKLASNSDSQNKGQAKDPQTIRGDKVIDPFKERKITFSVKEKKDAPPLFIMTVRGIATKELTVNDSIEDALCDVRRVTRFSSLSEIAVKTAFKMWQEQERDREERMARLAMIQSLEIDIVNDVRFVIEKHLNSKMKKDEIKTVIDSNVIQKELSELFTK